MDKRLLYEQMYYKEYDRKEKLNARLSIVITIFTIITGLISYILNDYILIYDKIGAHRIILLHMFIVALILYLTSFYFAIRTFIGYKYLYIPSANDIDEAFINSKQYFESYYELNKEYFKQQGITCEQLCEEHAKKMMIDLYKETSSFNFIQNNKKTKFLSICMYLLGALIFLCLSSCFYLIILK